MGNGKVFKEIVMLVTLIWCQILGLDLLDMRLDGEVVRTFLPRMALGIFSVKAMFTQVKPWLETLNLNTSFQNDEYVLYYNSGLKSILVFRVRDTRELARYIINICWLGVRPFVWRLFCFRSVDHWSLILISMFLKNSLSYPRRA